MGGQITSYQGDANACEINTRAQLFADAGTTATNPDLYRLYITNNSAPTLIFQRDQGPTGNSGEFVNDTVTITAAQLSFFAFGTARVEWREDPVFQIRETANISTSALTAAGGVCADLATILTTAPANNPPVAVAGADQTISLPTGGGTASVTLNGVDSSDPDGDSLSYRWTQISGPTLTVIPPAGKASASVITYQGPPSPAVTVFQLIVNDGTVDSAADTVTVNWVGTNTAPIANAGLDQNLLADFSGGGTAQSATLDATASSDPDGDTLSYAWTQLSGPATALVSGGTSAAPVYSQPANAGTVVYRVTVSDPGGETDTDDVSVIWGANTPPTNPAPATQNPAGPVLVGSAVPLSVGSPTDTDGNPVTVSWVQTGGTGVALSDPASPNPTFPAPAAGGTFTFQVTVSDGINETVKTVTVTLVIDQTPVADAGADQTFVDVAPGTVVTLDGTASQDPDGGTLTYMWTQTSGPTVTLSAATTAQPTFTFPPGGSVKGAAKSGGETPIVMRAGQPVQTLVFELVVSDGVLTSAADSTTVTINTNVAPVANAGTDQTVFGLDNGNTVELDGSASADPDGDTLSYQWSVVSGSATLSGDTTATPTLTYTGSASDSADEAVQVQLIVSDGVLSSPADTVTVNFRDNRAPTADAGADQAAINAGERVTLDGTGSSDADGDTLSYDWKQISGPSVTLSSSTAASPTFTAPDVARNTNLVFELIVSDGNVESAADRVTVGVQPVGSITIIQQASGGDSVFPFTSSLSGLTGSITTQGGTGQLTALRVNTGSYTVTAADKTADGYALTDLVCNDSDSTANFAQRTATIQLAPGEDVICTFSSVNSRAAAQKAIKEMLVQRSTMILSNQPDLTRRLDRLKGQASASGNVSIAGFQVASNSNIPLTAQISERGGKVAGSLSAMQGKGRRVGKGSFDIWGEGTFAKFDSLGKDGNFSIFYAGADYMLSDDVLIGALVQYDDFKSDSDNRIGDADGDGFMIGPYATVRLADNLYVDGRVAWGASENSISPLGSYIDDFDTDRFLIAGSVSGDFDLGHSFNLQPTFGVRNLSETQNVYTDSLGIMIPEQKISQGEVSFAPRLEKTIEMTNGWVFRPYGTVEGILSYGDEVENILGNEFRARLEGGAIWSSPGGVSAGITAFADGLGAEDFDAQGIRLSLSYVMK